MADDFNPLSLISAPVTGLFSAVGAGKQASAARDAAKMQTDAAKYGADQQTKASQAAEVFSRQQAENEWQNAQNVQQANYNQQKARYGSIAGVASQYGLNLGGMPDYQPGIDPHYTDAGTPAPGSVAAAGSAPAAGGGTGSAADLKALLDGGLDPQSAVKQFNQKYGRSTGNEAVYYDPSAHGGVATIGLPDAYLAKPGGSWDITQRSGAAAPKPGTIAAATPYASASAITAPAINTSIPLAYQPGTIGAYGRMQ